MADPEPPSLDTVRDLLITLGGGFLRNVRWQPGTTCTLCAGIPRGDFPSCYHCSGWIHRNDLADRLGFVSYAIDGTQSGRVMYGYKQEPASQANRRVVILLHHYTILRHWSCLNSSEHGPLTHWATVPSLRGRPGPHPLHALAAPLLDQDLPRAELRAAPGAVPSRDLRPANFTAEVPSGAHVLLVEDTWVGGGRVQSAAAVLKLAGASAVTALVLARWLDPGWGSTRDFLKTLDDDYDPDLCPFTGEPC